MNLFYSCYYLYYYLLSINDTVKKFDRGSGQPSIRKTDILDMEVDFPSLVNQQKIAAVLSALDSKIELNTKINNNLAHANDNVAFNLKEAA